jgi:signal transduction histidine kinase
MTAILGFAELLQTESDVQNAPPRQVEAVETIIRNGNYLLQLINNILDLSKIEAGKMTVENVECSPVQMIEEVVSLMLFENS